jgi:EmrB/QacA subfamily drug resistance transporter
VASSVDLSEGEAPSILRGGRPLALGALCLVLFLTFLDNTIVSVALGNVQVQLHAGVTALQWVVGAYALTFAGTMLAFGMVGDEFGRKRVMVIGVSIFCAGSVLSAVAPNIQLLIAGRAVMGLGAAACEPGTLSMIRHLYPTERIRARALGVWTAVSGLALAMGPVVGGALVGVWDWRAIFWFNVFFGLVALVAMVLVLPENSDPDAHRVDITGTVLGAAAITALAFAVILAEGSGFASPLVIALLAVSVGSVIAFFWWQYRAPHPLLDMRFVRVPRFFAANVTAFCVYFATFAIFFFTALYLEEVANYSGYQIAQLFLPMTVLMVAAAVLAGRWTTAVGPRWSIFAGSVLFGCGLLLTSLNISPSPSYLPLAASLALAGIGVGSTVVPITSSALAAVPPERSGMAASATNTSREVGAVAGVAVLGALVNAKLTDDITARMSQLGLSKGLVQYVVNEVDSGGLSGKAAASAAAANGTLGRDVLQAAYSAFAAGLHVSLVLAAILVLFGGVFTLVLLGRTAHATREETEPVAPPA